MQPTDVLLWNLEWAARTGPRAERLREVIAGVNADVLCLTETLRGFALEGLHTLESGPDYGYPNDSGERRKVVLASRSPWTETDTIGDPKMPTGRFVTGISAGIRWIGICIPWRDAHVRTGRKDRRRWEDHLLFLDGLKRVIARYAQEDTPMCVLGDFNQRFPKKQQPQSVYSAAVDAIGRDLNIVTHGMVDSEGKYLIDHAAVSNLLASELISVIEKRTKNGHRLSDHAGVVLRICHTTRSRVHIAPHGPTGK